MEYRYVVTNSVSLQDEHFPVAVADTERDAVAFAMSVFAYSEDIAEYNVHKVMVVPDMGEEQGGRDA